MTIQNLEDLVVSLVKKIRNKYNKKLRGEDLAKHICKDYGRTIKYRSCDAKFSGCHSPENKCIILNKSSGYPPRILFTLFHEITHFVIAEEGADIIEILTNYSRSNYQKPLELLCDLGAAEFLLPEEILKSRIGKNRIDIKLFSQLLQELEHASPPAIARKLAYLADYPGIFVICSENIFQDKPGMFDSISIVKKNLCIEYAFNTKEFKYPLKRFNPVSNNHILETCFSTKKDLSGDDYFPFSKRETKMKCYTEAFFKDGRVYAILYSKRLFDTTNQMSLL